MGEAPGPDCRLLHALRDYVQALDVLDPSRAQQRAIDAASRPVFELTHPFALKVLIRHGSSRANAEDDACATAARVLTHSNTFRQLNDPPPRACRACWAWVRRIAMNLLVDRHRREERDPLADFVEFDPRFVTASPLDSSTWTAPSAHPDVPDELRMLRDPDSALAKLLCTAWNNARQLISTGDPPDLRKAAAEPAMRVSPDVERLDVDVRLYFATKLNKPKLTTHAAGQKFGFEGEKKRLQDLVSQRLRSGRFALHVGALRAAARTDDPELRQQLLTLAEFIGKPGREDALDSRFGS